MVQAEEAMSIPLGVSWQQAIAITDGAQQNSRQHQHRVGQGVEARASNGNATSGGTSMERRCYQARRIVDASQGASIPLTVGLATLLLVLNPVATYVADASGSFSPLVRCETSKLKAATIFYGGVTVCHRRAALAGGAVDAACLQAATDKLTSRFGAAEAGGGCATNGDGTQVAAMITDAVASIRCRAPRSGKECHHERCGKSGHRNIRDT